MVARDAWVTVVEIEELRDREERDAERQHDVGHGDAGAKPVEVRDDEAIVFVISEHAEVKREPEQEPCAPRRVPAVPDGRLDAPGKDVVADDAENEQRQERDVPVRIKRQARRDEPDIGKTALFRAAKQKIARERHGQEEKEEVIGGEEHGKSSVTAR